MKKVCDTDESPSDGFVVRVNELAVLRPLEKPTLYFENFFVIDLVCTYDYKVDSSS